MWLIRLAILPILMLLLHGCGDAGWETYRSEEGEFSVSMPEEPEVEQYDAALPTGAMNIHAAESEGDSVTYLVFYADLPEYLVGETSPEDFVRDARHWIAGGMEGKILHDSSVRLKTHPGRELTVQSAGGTTHRIHLYVAGGRLYHVMMVGPPTEATEPRAKRFFNSFTIERS